MKETELKKLENNLSKEEEDIVDAIIGELNSSDISNNKSDSHKKESQSSPQSPNEQEQLMKEQKMKYQQQQMMQQQMMQQQMIQQQMMLNKSKENTKKEDESLVNKLKKDIKEPIIVSFLILFALLPQTDILVTFTKISTLFTETGLTTVGMLIKSIILGIVFFVIKKYVL